MSPYLIHVLDFSQQSNKLKDLFKCHMFPQRPTLIQFVNIYFNLALIRVPGWESGFLASDAVRAARNVNICLVP